MADRRCTQVTLAEDLRRRAGEARTKSATPVLAEALADLSAERRGDVIAALEDLHRALVGAGRRSEQQPFAGAHVDQDLARPEDHSREARPVTVTFRPGGGLFWPGVTVQ
jgi:hypothetical protein